MSNDAETRDTLLSHVEETFGIRLTDEERRSCHSVGDVERLVRGRVPLNGPARSLLPVARDRTRAALAAALDREVPLDARLERAFPRVGRPERWERFQRALGASVGSVRRPEWVPALVVFVTLMTGYLLLIFSRAEHLFYRWYHYLTWDVIAGGALAAGALAYLLTRFVSNRVPYETGEEVALVLATDPEHHAGLNGGDGRWSPEQVREVVEILAKLCYGPNGVTSDTPLPR